MIDQDEAVRLDEHYNLYDQGYVLEAIFDTVAREDISAEHKLDLIEWLRVRHEVLLNEEDEDDCEDEPAAPPAKVSDIDAMIRDHDIRFEG